MRSSTTQMELWSPVVTWGWRFLLTRYLMLQHQICICNQITGMCLEFPLCCYLHSC